MHVSKAINFSAMKKSLGKQPFGECAVSIIIKELCNLVSILVRNM
jgi:hypothetical protein